MDLTTALLILTCLIACAICVGGWRAWRDLRFRANAQHDAHDLLAEIVLGISQGLDRLEQIVIQEAAGRLVEKQEAAKLPLGSFLPDDATAARLEREHRQARQHFLDARTPQGPSPMASGSSGNASSGGTSMRAARSSRRP